ncbi:MAG: hypothetical protein Q7R41_14615, partial [Phycisphaerales bacterium]|nr:hypothetical protein [Phycisphaerales bacterium]
MATQKDYARAAADGTRQFDRDAQHRADAANAAANIATDAAADVAAARSYEGDALRDRTYKSPLFSTGVKEYPKSKYRRA